MMMFETFEEIVYETAETFPEDFYRELNGGVVVRRCCRLHPKAVANDLFVLGEYHRNQYLGRMIVLYFGSFERCFGYVQEEVLRDQIRKVLLHEFRHHLEALAGEKDLEIEDAEELSRYLYRSESNINKN